MMPLRRAPTLHLTNAYHETSGGIRTFYHAAIEAANREERPFRLVVPAARSAVEVVGPFARIYRIAAPRAPVIDSRYRLLLPHRYLFPWPSLLRRILAAEQPALVEITDKYTLPWLAGALRRGWVPGVPRPVLVGLSCERMDDNIAAYLTAGRVGRRFAELYMRHLYVPLFDYHIAASGYIAEELDAAAAPRMRARVAVRALGVDFQRFHPEHRSPALRDSLLGRVTGSRPSRLLLYAGRLSPEKNVALLVEMMAILAGDAACDYTLAVAGSGPLEGWLRAAADRTAPGRVRFVPHITDRDTLAALYASSDAFVHPNPREPFGIGPLEAMASGCPLVGPRAGGILTYASDENAWLAATDGATFAAAIRDLETSPERRARRIAQARDTAASYDWPLVMRRLFAHYDDLISAGPEAALGAAPRRSL